MNPLIILILLLSFQPIQTEPIDNLLLFTHPTAPSHLSGVFDLAERFNDSENIHDIRFPMLETISNFKTRKNFKLHNFDFAMKKSNELKRYLDEISMKNSASIYDGIKMVKGLVETLMIPCELKDKIFDYSNKSNLALIDVFSSACNVILARKHDARIVYFAPTAEPSTISSLSGSPLPGYSKGVIKIDSNVDFFNRLIHSFSHVLFKLFFIQIPLIKWWHNGNDGKVYGQLEESLMIVNVHKFLSFPIPRTNLIVETGNLIEKEVEQFDGKTQQFINSYDSIVYFSMSTYTSDGQLPSNLISQFTIVFKKFSKVGFIWRLKEELVDSPPENVHFINWIDQRALLGHPKLKLLITHCGMFSFLEAAHSGVPLIGMPTIGDQYLIAETVKKLQMGIILDLHSLNETQLFNAIHQILKPNSVESKSAKKIKDMLSFEREKKMNLDGSFGLKRFMRMKQGDFEKFWILKNIDWFRHFYFDLVLGFVSVLVFVY